ncbi:MAG: DUF6913 domain-containing protein [Prolixibacteraceae bacterium]
MKLIEKYATYRFHKKLADTDRKPKVPASGELKKVGVLWRPEEKDAYSYLRNHFSHSKVIFRNLCIYGKVSPPQANSNAVTKKDLNWMGLPVSVSVENFIETEFDLLLNVSLQQNLILDYITAMSRAKFKIGWSPVNENYFDLNINIGRKQDAMYLARQQIFYLDQLNKTKTDE